MGRKAAGAAKAPDAYHHGGLRDALLEAAAAEVAQSGPEAVNFSALAKGLGVTQAAPYRHFADRDDLLTELTTRSFRDFGAHLARAAKRRSTRSALRRLAHAYVDYGRKQAGTYRLMYATRYLERAEIGSELQQAADENFQLLLSVLGPARDEPARARIAIKFLAALHGIVMYAQQGLLPPKMWQVTVEDLVDELAEDTESAMMALSGPADR